MRREERDVCVAGCFKAEVISSVSTCALHLLWEQTDGLLRWLVTNTVTGLSVRLMIIISPHLSRHHNVQPAMRKLPQCFQNKLIDNEITGVRPGTPPVV